MMRYLRNSVYAVLLLTLAGCASHSPPVPKEVFIWQAPRQVLVTEINPKTIEPVVWQVVVQQQAGSLRWLRFNLLGAPDARQILANGKWRNDGFMPPNQKVRELFAALLFAWTHPRDLIYAYPYPQYAVQAFMDKWVLKENSRLRWTVIWQDWSTKPNLFSIKDHKSGIIWQVRPLENPDIK